MMDLASYFNETMLDNRYPFATGIKCYLPNCISDSEIDQILEAYITHAHVNFKVSLSLPLLRVEARKCMLLNNFLGAIWAMQVLKKEDYGRKDLFNFELAKARLSIY